MKQFYLLVILVLGFIASFAQSTEVEPNNSFSTASPLNDGGTITSGALGAADTIDYHSLNYRYNGGLYMIISVTNTGSSGTQQLDLNLFNSLRSNGDYVGNFYGSGYQVNQGQTFTDSILICGLAIDSFFLRLKSQGQFSYNIEWYHFNIYEADDLFLGYNNTAATATPFSFDVEKEASLAHQYWGNNLFDSVDYFTTTLPPADYDEVKLLITGQNNACNGTAGMQYACFKNGNLVPFAQGFVGGNPAISPYQSESSIIPLNNMQQGDVLLVKYTATNPFGYNFRYGLVGEFVPDVEDNCCTFNAKPILENETLSGNVGEYDFNQDQYIDEYDMYRIILPQDGAFKLFVKGRNDECTSSYYQLSVDVLDKYGIDITGEQLIEWDNVSSCGIIKFDTTKFRAFASDTFYLRFRSNGDYGKVSYSFRYEFADGTVSDANETYAGTSSTNVIPIAAGENKKGHLRFKKNYFSSDPQDLYTTNITTGGNFRVYLKATFRGDLEEFNSNSNGDALTFIGFGVTRRMPANPPVTYILPDAVYNDTFLVCGVDTGLSSFLIRAQLPYEYEVRYEQVEVGDNDNDAEPNNSFAQATLASATTVKKGHINYYGATTDTYDYYKIVVNANDTLKIYVQGTNKSCQTNRYINFNGYNKNQTLIFGQTMGFNYNILPNQTITDSIKIFVTAPDTIYLRFDATAPFNYQFYFKPIKPTSLFSIEGDSTVCIGTTIYTARNSVQPNESVIYNWSLPLGGGSLSFVDSVATVTWNTTGNRSIALSLSNTGGNSVTKTVGVVVNNSQPSQIPIALNFARNLSTSNLPAGSNCQWFRNGVLIVGAILPSYYAGQSGTYSVKFVNDCGEGPASNTFSFAADAITQNINFPNIANQAMSPTAKVKLAATASSGLPVLFQKISGPGNILNDSLYITGAGTIIIRAVQPGDDIYNAAPSVNDTIIVVKGNQVISFDSIYDQIFVNDIFLNTVRTSSSGYYVFIGSTDSIITVLQGLSAYLKGVGRATITAFQPGDQNYNAAVPVQRSFCVGIRNIKPIVGDANPCLATYKYTTQKIPGAMYVWTLSSGGILTTNNDTAMVQWQTPGNHSITVKARSSCDATFSDVQTFNVITSNNVPASVTNMLPVNNSINQQLPLQLSWIPGSNTVNYDLYVWNASVAQPAVPFAANINTFTFTIPNNSLAFNTTYKWRVVAKNPCSQTAGPIQEFSVIPLPDLAVSEVSAPATANSGQTITISWKVSNLGPGFTNTNQSWKDAVFLSFDTLPNFTIPPNAGNNWVFADFPVRTKIIATVPNVTALSAGQHYTNSVSYTLPINLSSPVYAYIITNYQPGNNAPLQVTRMNDTARNAQPVVVTLSPTPDLRIDTVFTPFTTFSGSTIGVTYRVKNYGVLTPAGANWGDSVFMSQSPFFDRSNAFPLTLPKFNDTYYYNASNAGITVGTQVLSDSSYVRTINAVIPNFIFGTYYIHVKANANGRLHEGAFGGNNLNYSTIQIYLTPTPRLTINNLNVPTTNASTTQPIAVNWNIINEGFADNKERNKGHILSGVGTCYCYVISYNPYQYACQIRYVDNLVLGSSHWIEKVYLSKDSTGLNTDSAIFIRDVLHGTAQGALLPEMLDLCGDGRSRNIETALNPRASFVTDGGFRIPDTLQPGSYYVYVVTNPTKTVFEYPGTLQVKRSPLPINVQRPDIIPPVMMLPANVTGAQTFAVNYTVTNNGPGAVFSYIRRDRIYVSNFPNFDASAQLITTRTVTENLPVGVAVPQTYNYSFPAATSGVKYFYVHSNFDSAFKETNRLNNLSTAYSTTVTPAIAADLVVSNIILADTVFTIFTNRIIYTVTNNGPGASTSTFTDSIFISCSNSFNNNTNNFVVRKVQGRVLAAGASYTDTIYFAFNNMSNVINGCFPLVTHAPAYFYVKTNASNSQYEGSNANNNVRGSGLRVLKNPFADPIVTVVNSLVDTVTVGRPMTLGYSLKNIGFRPPTAYYGGWFDGVYFSPDSIFNAGDVLSHSMYRTNPLATNQSISYTAAPIVPNIATGDYYVLVNTDYQQLITGNLTNNNVNFLRNASGAARKIHVIRPLLPDLADSILFATASVAVGQQVKFKNRTTNIGAGETYPSPFTNKLWLANDYVTTDTLGDKFLSAKVQNRIVQPGQFFDDSVTVTIPINTVPGNYILKSRVNGTGNVFETNTANNFSFSLVNVFRPAPADLLVQNIIAPDTVYLGYTIDTLKWVISNLSANAATGVSADGVYVSKGASLDSSASLIGIKNKTLNMAALSSDTVRMAVLVDNVIEGNYNIIVKTDLLNNIVEDNKDNNTATSITPIYVGVKRLPINVLVPNTMRKETRYYKLIIPDSLLGSTIKITLKTNDSSLVRNEMYVGANYIPSNARFDYKFEIPNYGNQQIVITDVFDSVYYISYKAVSPNPPQQNVTLKAEKLPFSILNVNSPSGGNIGNVTVKISGSLYRDSMVAKLSNAGTTILSSAVYFTNSTTVYATFNLAGKPLGLYDVTLTKPDGSAAFMQNGFSIVPANNGGLITGGGVNSTPGNGNAPGCDPGAPSGLNSQLSVQLVVPNIVVVNWPFTIQINYSNPTNGDISIQSRTLYSELGEKLSLTQAGVEAGTTSLYLELAEQGGPPGIIRAGGSGTINVYSKSPRALTNGFNRQKGNFRLQ